ncbi:MAG: surface attachment protein Sap1 [Janthinobacterium lividum]
MKAVAYALISLSTLLVATTAAQAQDKIAPSQVFRFKPNAYGCLSKEKFDAADTHARAGESGKVQQFFAGYECVSTPESSDFRIVRVVGHDVEFVNAGNNDRSGLWTNDRFIRQ